MITLKQKSEIRQLANKFSYIVGREADDINFYPKKLTDITAVRFKNKENPRDYFNGKIGIIIAYSKKAEVCPLTAWAWDGYCRCIPSKNLVELGTIGELFKDLSLKDEFLEREKLQDKLKPITIEDFMDFYNELKVFENGIDIFLKEVKDES